MRSAAKTLLTITILSLLLSGCATNRGVVSLQIAEANKPAQANGQSIYVRSVTDNRMFERNPRSPDIPSLGFGGADNAANEIKKRAIARKRNSFGKALGDILLEEHQTVESVIGDSLAKSFYELGYEVISAKENLKANTIIVDTSIQKFWSWMNIGFWALTLSSEIETVITLSNDQENPKKIYVKSQGNYQVASGGNWLEIMNKSLQQFNVKVKENLAAN